jgi:hypothetical protein
MEERKMVRSIRRLAIAAGGGVGVVLVVLAVLTIPSAATLAEPIEAQSASLVNPGFEGGMGYSQVYWTRDEGGPFFPGVDPGIPRRDNIRPPEGWTAWWRDKYPCDLAYTFNMAQPEMVVIGTIPDPLRIHEGDQALKAFTFRACHDMGILQTVSAVSGTAYLLEAWGHAWYSSCSTEPHLPPLLPNCTDPWGDAHDYLSVGIDPTGGIDPLGSDVVWGQEVEIYGVYSHSITVTAKAQASQITVFLRSRADTPLKHDDAYWDSVSLSEHLGLQAWPSTLAFLGEVGGTEPEPWPITIDSSSLPLSWTATVSPTVSWLTLSAPSGTTPAVVTATASTSGLGIGQYTTEITIESKDALSGSPHTIPVTVVIVDEVDRVLFPLFLGGH